MMTMNLSGMWYTLFWYAVSKQPFKACYLDNGACTAIQAIAVLTLTVRLDQLFTESIISSMA